MKKSEAVILNDLLGQSKLGKMSGAGKSAVIRTKIKLGRISKEVEEAKQEAINSLRTPEFDRLNSKERSELTSEESAELANLMEQMNRDFAQVLNPILMDEADIEWSKISADDFDAFCEVNDFNVAQLEFLMENMVE
ncbi:MAG: hypothetical protein PUB21_00715 [Bacteroidales bacterium]|nr:hypothetical protein [Bacteroidales bacterium]